MNLALRRFRLEGIGPAGARFDPLAVDLTTDLTAGGHAARSAVLFLENGGGKSVLLRLLFAVVLPGRRQTVGGAKLEGYVLTGDTGHVALEWDLPDGSRLVTGLVLEWRGRQRSGTAANLLPLWYSFVPVDGALTFDTLPTTDSGRRRTRTGYREQLTDLAKAHPRLQLVVEDQPGRWQDHLLTATPLDPEAFRYQRTMNADEADAESLFAGIRDDDGFVRFVVEAVHDADELAGFGDLVTGYAAQLARRDALVAEARFAAAAATALGELADAWEGRAAARARAAAAEGDAAALRRSLDAGVDAAHAAEQAARAEAAAAAEQQRAVTSQADKESVTAAELRRLDAAFLHQQALAAETEVRAALDSARRRVEAWAAVPDCLERTAREAELARLREAQESAERDLAPLRSRAGADEARYAARLRAEAARLDDQVGESGRRAAEADAAAEELEGRAVAAVAEAARLTELRRGLVAQVETAAAAVAAARTGGWVRATEDVDAAVARLAVAGADATGALANARARRARIQGEQREATQVWQKAEGAFDEHRRELGAVRRDLDERVAEAAALVASDRLGVLAPGAVDLWAVADPVVEALTASVGGARTAARRLDERIHELQSELDALRIDGLLPPPPEVRRVWDALTTAGIAATSGWQWLADKLDGDARTAALERNPGLAGGVLLADPARLDDARRALGDAGVETAGVVVLGSPDGLAAPADLGREALSASADLAAPAGPGAPAGLASPAARGVPAPVRPGQYDPAWAARERDRCQADIDEAEADRQAARVTLAVDEPLLDQIQDLLRRCPITRRVELAGRVERLEAAVAAAADARDAAATRLDQLNQLVGDLDAAEPGLVEIAGQAAEALRAARALAAQASAAAAAATEATAAEEGAERSQAEAEQAARGGRQARQTAERERATATAGAADAAALRARAAVLAAVEVPDSPPDVPTEALRAGAEASRRAYETERAGRDLTPALEAVEAQLARVSQVIAGLPPAVVTEALTLARQPAAGDDDARRRAVTAAQQRVADADRARDAAVGATSAAAEVLKQRSPAERNRIRHVVLDPADEPATAEEAAARAAVHTAEFARLTQEARRLGTTAQVAEEQAQAAAVRARLLAAAAVLLPPAPEPSEHDPTAGGPGVASGGPPPSSDPTEPWPGSPEAAQAAAEQVRAALDQARSTLGDAERALERAESVTRATAADPAHRAVSGLRVALADEPVESLAPRARPLADELAAMRASAESELADIARHREGLVIRLATLVDHHLGLLSRLATLSKLPDDLGGWSRRPFLAVEFDRHDAAQLPARLEPVVDAAAAGDDRRRAGPLDVLLAGMRAAVAPGPDRPPFRVSILRPNRTMREERATVVELEREFSGGMKLTVAICTYCALAALRAGTRSRGGLFGAQPGPLFLDNPLGKASADYLLDLQHRLAAKLGVQLVHTTGVWDVEALGAYERFVRLRNLSDLRANLAQIRVDPDVDLGIRLDGTGVDGAAFTRRRS